MGEGETKLRKVVTVHTAGGGGDVPLSLGCGRDGRRGQGEEILMATKKKVTVEVNGQQYRLIQQLREKGTYRNTDTGVIVKGFREWGEKKLVERPS